jgi:hypothetical protein
MLTGSPAHDRTNLKHFANAAMRDGQSGLPLQVSSDVDGDIVNGPAGEAAGVRRYVR